MYPGLKISFEHNSVRKSLFLSECFCWDSRLFLREMAQNFKFGGLNGYGNSYMDSVFRYPNVFRLHAKLHDAAEKFDHKPVKDLATAIRLVDVQTFICLVT